MSSFKVRIVASNSKSSIPPKTKQYPIDITVHEWFRQLDLVVLAVESPMHRHWLIAPGDEKRLKRRPLGQKGPGAGGR